MAPKPKPKPISKSKSGFVSQEQSFVITKSKLDHIESLAKRADFFIKQEPYWDKVKERKTACVSIASSFLLSLISGIGVTLPVWSYVIQLSCLLTSIACAITCHFSIRDRAIEKAITHDSYLEEIKGLLKSLKE